MKTSFLPSKTFLIRGGIATGVVAVILMSQTNWFHTLFHKKGAAPLALSPDTTLGDLVQKDSNGNGIPDWQERLWGLDPTTLYTNGTPNASVIAQKQKAAGVSATISGSSENNTDKLARDLFALSTTLGANQSVDDSTLASVAGELGRQITIDINTSTYKSSDIHTIPTTATSLRTYRTRLQTTLTKYGADAPNIEIVLSALEKGDFSNLEQLSAAATQYASVAKSLKSIPVPIGVAAFHLDIMNGFAGMAKSFVYLKDIDTDGLDALSGLAVYKNYSQLFSNAVTNLNEYLAKYDIL